MQPSGPKAPAQTRRDKLLREYEHDTYKLPGKLPDPTACPRCRALFRDGRWSWGSPPSDAQPVACPACRRIEDDYPAGTLTLSGAFAQGHRDEILGLARHVEEREKAEHPLKRIMAIRDEADAILVTTTDAKLARSIGEAIHRAYEGEVGYTFTKDENLLRVTWER
jgi:NMD protein affecting ribosome stability and mRNA decay